MFSNCSKHKQWKNAFCARKIYILVNLSSWVSDNRLRNNPAVITVNLTWAPAHSNRKTSTWLSVNLKKKTPDLHEHKRVTGQQMPWPDRCQLIITEFSNIKDVRCFGQFISWTRPPCCARLTCECSRAIPLAMFKAIHGFLWIWGSALLFGPPEYWLNNAIREFSLT